jgi:hypothetical protein
MNTWGDEHLAWKKGVRFSFLDLDSGPTTCCFVLFKSSDLGYDTRNVKYWAIFSEKTQTSALD